MSKKSKVLKYKVVNTNIDKKFIGKNLDLERVKSKGGPGDGGRKPGSKNKMTLDKLAKIVTDGFTEQAKFNTRIEKEVLNLGNRLDRVIKVNNLKE
ncbi:MAG: hypothetical protein IJK72_00955 [Mycoplasma sp.]|nr:hypothetical protein [Mycoplasma sp.]